MVLTDRELTEQLDRFYQLVSERVRLIEYILFGSYARGTPRHWSDVDVAVISPDWDGLSRQERMTILGRWAWEAGAPWVEPVGYTPDEMTFAAANSFVGDIRDKGISYRPGETTLPKVLHVR